MGSASDSFLLNTFSLSSIHLTCQLPFSSVTVFEMLSHTSFHYWKEIWHLGRQYFLLLSNCAEGMMAISQNSTVSSIDNISALWRKPRIFFFFWCDANCTFYISHQWDHHFALNSYVSTFISIKELWWHCFDIPLALAFSYVSIRSRNKKGFCQSEVEFEIAWCYKSDKESWI